MNNPVKSELIVPFVRWAGGKTWLTKIIEKYLPSNFNNYHEPFVGGGALYFHINPKNISFLSDLNNELIISYKQIKKNPDKIIAYLNNWGKSETNFYFIRAQKPTNPYEVAARFIFLNKLCFNGIYRVNSSGMFNVPYGKNRERLIYTKENLNGIKQRLKSAKLNSYDFEKSLDLIEKNDLVILDPPYTVAHKNNGFIEYNQKIFSWDDQQRLAEYTNNLMKKGAKFILTNAAHSSIETLYKFINKKYEISRNSTIAGSINNRKKITEFLFTNIN